MLDVMRASTAILFLLSLKLYAGVPSVTTFQARIIGPSGAPVEASKVNFRFTILDSAGTCTLYIEDYANVNMGFSQGIATFGLGSGTKVFPTSSVALVDVFNNSATSFPCQAGGSYTPGPVDRRQVVMQFNDGTGGWQTVPQVAINSVFYSTYANRAENLGDYPAQDYLRPVSLPVCTGSQALNYNGSNFVCIAVGAAAGGAVTSVTGTSPVVITGGTSTPVVSMAKATGSVSGYLSSADWTAFSTKASAFLTSGQIYLGNASNDATGAVLSGDATIANSGVLTLANSGVSAGAYGSSSTIPFLTIDSKGRVTSASSGAYQDATGAAKGIVRIGSNLTIAAGVLSMQSSDITSALGYTPMSGTGSAFVNNGNIFSSDATLGTNDNYNLFLKTNNINRVTISNAGNVGIGSGTPTSKLTVSGDVNISGTYYVNGVAISSGTVSSVSSTNADIAVATGSSTPVLTLNSGTGNNQIVKLTAAGKYPAVDGSLITNLSFSSFGTSTLPIANGGTNSSTPLNNNRIIISTAGQIVEAPAMTNGQILVGSTGAAPVASTLIAGNGILIGNGAGTISPSVDVGIGANKIPQVGGVALP